jgi:diguanylate cyclase (GGDEF)-like protein
MIKNAGLKDCNEFLGALLENLVSAVFVVDEERRFQAYNQSFMSLFHKMEDEISERLCDGTSGCQACKLRDSLPEALTFKIPAYKERLTQKFYIGSREVVRYFLYSTQHLDVKGEKMIMVILDDITGQVEADLRLKRMAITDSLTQLYNHKYLYSRLEEEFTRARRYGNKLSILVLDIDRFRKVNDNYGHQQGDKALATVGGLIRTNLRQIDTAGRYDSVEFIVILPQTSLDNAFLTAERIRQAVETHTFNKKGLKMTLSGGLAEFKKGDKSALHLIDRAEHLLYEAKKKGRNRIER